MSFLDSKFPTFEHILQGLEKATEDLQTEQNDRKTQREASTQEAAAIAQRATANLQQILADPEKSNPKVVEKELSRLPLQVCDTATDHYANLLNIYEVRAAVVKASALVTKASSIKGLIEADLAEAGSLYSQEVGSLDEIAKIMHDPATSSVVSNIALQAYDFVETQVRQPIVEKANAKLEKALDEAQWPSKEPTSGAFLGSLRAALAVEQDTAVLTCFHTIAKQLDVRIKFNFSTTKDTFRADKPEWLLDYFFKLIEPHMNWLKTTVQPVLAERFPKRFALNELCSGLLPSLVRALKVYIDAAQDTPELLSHVIAEMSRFDSELEARFFYVPADIDQQDGLNNNWIGLTGTVLEHNPDLFERWLQAEKTEASRTVEDIIRTESTWNVDWDAVDVNATKPTVSALNVKLLFEGITEKYRQLKIKTYQLRFLSEIQLTILEKYYTTIMDSISVFRLQSSIGRAVGAAQAVDKKNLEGFQGVQYAGRLYASVTYLRSFLAHESQDILFVELFKSVEKSLDNPDAGMFDEPVKSIDAVRERCGSAIVSIISKQFQTSLRNYVSLEWRLSESQVTDMSPALSSPIGKLSEIVTYLKKLFSPVDFAYILQPVSASAADLIWNNVVQGNTFTLAGGKQLAADIDVLWTNLHLLKVQSYYKIEAAAKILSGIDADLNESDKQNILRRRVN